MRAHKDRTEFRLPCGLWRKYIFATSRARDAHVRRRVSVDRDAFRQKQKNPFQEKVFTSISREKRGLQSRKSFERKKTARTGGRAFFSRTPSPFQGDWSRKLELYSVLYFSLGWAPGDPRDM